MMDEKKKRYAEELQRTRQDSDLKLAALRAFARATDATDDMNMNTAELRESASREAVEAVRRGTYRDAHLVEAAFTAHDANATALTEARKVLRELEPYLTVGRRAALNDAIDILNLSIIASRKLVKGELP